MKLKYYSASDLGFQKINCSVCGRPGEEGYCPESFNDDEYQVLEAKLGIDAQDWFICKQCVGDLSEKPILWLERLKKRRT